MDSTQVITTISKGIDMISKKLSVPANKILEIMQQQIKYDLYMNMIYLGGIILLLITDIILSIKYIKSMKNEKGWFNRNYYNSGVAFALTGIALGAVFVICICAIFYFIQQIVQIDVNPYYYMYLHYIKPLFSKN